LLVERGGEVFGAPTVVTTRLTGRPVLAPANVDEYTRQIAETLVHLHRLPTTRLDFLPDQAALLSRTLAQHQVADDPLEPDLRRAVLRAWPSVAPMSARIALVHGAYWPGNLLWQRGHLVAVVDWMDARLGDPARDVGTCRADLSLLFGPDAADAFLRYYELATGRPVQHRAFWDLLSCTLALPEVPRRGTRWLALGRTDLTIETALDRLRAMASAARDLTD
jgi:aminoglycoside phosphotransferase (APT) family kinase protein